MLKGEVPSLLMGKLLVCQMLEVHWLVGMCVIFGGLFVGLVRLTQHSDLH
jgi:hypothetical protein